LKGTAFFLELHDMNGLLERTNTPEIILILQNTLIFIFTPCIL